MKKVILVLNMEKEKVTQIADRVIEWLQAHNVSFDLVKVGSKELAKGDLNLEAATFSPKPDCLIILGGDGTILSCARTVAKEGIPVFGINLGRLGFLTEIEVKDIVTALNKLINNEYHVEERMMIEAKVIRDGKVVEDSFGLNDAVITKGAFARLIQLEIMVNDEFYSEIPADGLIVSSPTGSTAYSLSAGGPLVPPNLDLIIITPICPHTLTSRPLVIAPENVVKVRVLSHQNETMLTLDGQHGFQIQPRDVIIVQKASFRARFIKLKGRSFFSLVRNKLKEGNDTDV